jgi:DNA-binding CsgD family transcriptional regulator
VQARLDAIDGYDHADATSSYRAQVLAELALQRGDDAEAARQTEVLRASALARSEPQWIGPLEAIRAQLALRAGDADAAGAIVREALERLADVDDTVRLAPLRWVGARAAADGALPPRGSGDVAEGRAHADVLARHARELPEFPEIAAYAALARAEVERVGRTADAAAGFGEAVAGFEALGLAWPAAYARTRQAEALVEGGDRDAAAEVLAPALAWAEAAGAAPLAFEARSLARRARLSLDEPAADRPPERADPTPADGLGLTPRELEVLELVADGRTNREIGAVLYMSEKTASVHVSRILAKLGVRSRVEAAGVAHRLGLPAAR